MTCFKCKNKITKSSLAMNLPYVTPGPVYYCHSCEPVPSAKKIFEQFDSFLNPPREREVK